MRNRSRHLSLLLALAIPLALSLPGAAALADGLKNLQVLPKSTSKDEVKQIMKAQAKALDVECDFCHDVPDMASDKNPKKLTARQMMRMTAEINQHWLKGMKDAEKNKVTCVTCHRGKEIPDAR
ncbi:MAG: c-type cytochrome [Polyangia bacterium]